MQKMRSGGSQPPGLDGAIEVGLTDQDAAAEQVIVSKTATPPPEHVTFTKLVPPVGFSIIRAVSQQVPDADSLPAEHEKRPSHEGGGTAPAGPCHETLTPELRVSAVIAPAT